MKNFNDLFTDRWMNWLCGATAYFLLLTAVVYAQTGEVNFYSPICGLFAVGTVVRTIIVLACKKEAPGTDSALVERLSAGMPHLKALAYVWLLGVVMAPVAAGKSSNWIFYAFLGWFALIFVIALIKKPESR